MTMRLLRFTASKDDAPEWVIETVRCYHDRLLGIDIHCGMRRYRWMWRLCR